MTTTAPETFSQHLDAVITLAADAPTDSPWELTFTALGLPYAEELRRFDWTTGAERQMWSEDSVTVADNNQVHFGHDWQSNGLPIGRILSAEQTPEGILITGGISKTAKGIEVATLMRDGVLTRVSAGLTTSAWHMEEDGALLVHDASEAFEFSIVPQPAFDTAAIQNVNTKEKDPVMPEQTPTIDPAALADLATAVTNLERRVETLPSTLAASATPAPVPFRSRGAALKALISGDDQAHAFLTALSSYSVHDGAFLLAYEGGTIGDLGAWVKDSWIGDAIHVATENRIVLNSFRTQALPSTGMNVEYGVISEDTTQVAKQAAEGDTLAYGKIAFDTKTAPVITAGGWGELTRQQVERSGVNIIDRFFAALDRKYAQFTEAQVRAVVQTAAGATTVPGIDLTTSDGWIDFLIESAAALDAKGLTLDGVLLSKDEFKALAKLRDGANGDAIRFLSRTSGSVSITKGEGDVLEVPFKMVPSFTAGTVRSYSADAIVTLESGGPTRLTDGDITNLTEAFSEYGYIAVAPEDPTAIIVPGA